MPLVGWVPDGDGVSDEAPQQQLGVPGSGGIVLFLGKPSFPLDIVFYFSIWLKYCKKESK